MSEHLGPFRREVVSIAPLPGTKSGHECRLECGHIVYTFGKLAHLPDGKVLCTECRKGANAAPR